MKVPPKKFVCQMPTSRKTNRKLAAGESSRQDPSSSTLLLDDAYEGEAKECSAKKYPTKCKIEKDVVVAPPHPRPLTHRHLLGGPEPVDHVLPCVTLSGKAAEGLPLSPQPLFCLVGRTPFVRQLPHPRLPLRVFPRLLHVVLPTRCLPSSVVRGDHRPPLGPARPPRQNPPLTWLQLIPPSSKTKGEISERRPTECRRLQLSSFFRQNYQHPSSPPLPRQMRLLLLLLPSQLPSLSPSPSTPRPQKEIRLLTLLLLLLLLVSV